MFKQIVEGGARIIVPVEEKISRDLPVFYNPIMKMNRDISSALLQTIKDKDWVLGLPLSGSGVRAVRFLKEVCITNPDLIERIDINDNDKSAIKVIKKNLALNGFRFSRKVKVTNQDANTFLDNSTGYHYIDIDPFGSPVNFLDRAIVRLGRGGILAISATDTAALCGVYPKVTRRRYWAESNNKNYQHERAIRILIRRVQLIGAQYDKALEPIISYQHEHYVRVFFRCLKSRDAVDKMMKKHKLVDGLGPFWMGNLQDSKTLESLIPFAGGKTKKFIECLFEESKVDVSWYYDIHKISKRLKVTPASNAYMLLELEKIGHKATITHIDKKGIRTTASLDEVEKIIKRFA